MDDKKPDRTRDDDFLSGGGPVGKDHAGNPFQDTQVETGEPPPPSDRNADGLVNPNIKPPDPSKPDRQTS